MDPRKILNVGEDATLDDIHRAYRLKATKYHPDHGGEAWAFQQVRDAYEKLIGEHEGPNDDGVVSAAATEVRSPQTNDPLTRPAPHKSVQSSGTAATTGLASGVRWLWQLGFRQLPLQDETTVYILVSVLDIFMTYILIRFGGIEANPVALWFLDRWDFAGMVFFKMALIAFVSVVAQAIAHRNLARARMVLMFGTVVTVAVVVYSVLLFVRHFGG